MILANLLLFMAAIFFMPDWIFGSPNVFPPYPQKDIVNTVSEGIQTVANAAKGAVEPLLRGPNGKGAAKEILNAVTPK